MTALAQLLLRARLNKDLTQGKLAMLSGVPPANISKYENDRMLPSLDNLRRLARALDIPWATALRALKSTSGVTLTTKDKPQNQADFAIELEGVWDSLTADEVDLLYDVLDRILN